LTRVPVPPPRCPAGAFFSASGSGPEARGMRPFPATCPNHGAQRKRPFWAFFGLSRAIFSDATEPRPFWLSYANCQRRRENASAWRRKDASGGVMTRAPRGALVIWRSGGLRWAGDGGGASSPGGGPASTRARNSCRVPVPSDASKSRRRMRQYMHQHWLHTPRPSPNTVSKSTHRAGVSGAIWISGGGGELMARDIRLCFAVCPEPSALGVWGS
jgi:hypothetical protein